METPSAISKNGTIHAIPRQAHGASASVRWNTHKQPKRADYRNKFKISKAKIRQKEQGNITIAI